MAQKPKKSKRFRYNLQTVLKYRNIRETQEQEKFNKAEQAFLEEKRKEEEIKAFQIAKYLELKQEIAAGKVIDFQQIMMRRSHLDTLKEKVINQEKARVEAEEKKEKQREELVKAVKDRKILDKDKEKKRKAWVEVMKKEEDKFLGEISTIKFAAKERKRAEEQLDQDRRTKRDQES